MIKSFLIIISFSTLLFSSQQILLVVADDFNTSHAKLECYEGNKLVCKDIDVNLGFNGLGWGLGIVNLHQKKDDPIKHEGDKKAPAGVFKLSMLFGYDKHNNFKMPYLQADKHLICVDDSNSKYYNKLIDFQTKEKSFEYMKRKDNLYALGIVVAHNAHARPQRGSCIFLHIQRGKDIPTVGCTSMQESALKSVASWLDKEKNPILIQIPKSAAQEIKKLYPTLKNSTLLL